MQRGSLLALVLAPLLGAACDPEPGPGVDELIIASDNVGRDFTIWVGWPEGNPPTEGWPSLYLLDADLMFTSVHAMLQEQAARGALPPILLVGVGYGSGEDMRDTDYTPVAAPEEDGYGGGPAFHAFLAEELAPAIEAGWPTTLGVEARGLAGHSYGGLFGVYALFQEPPAFRRILAASASIPYANGAVLDEEVEYRAAHPECSLPTTAFFTMGDGDGVLMALYLDELLERLSSYHDLVHDDLRLHGDYHPGSWKPAYEAGLPFLYPVEP